MKRLVREKMAPRLLFRVLAKPQTPAVACSRNVIVSNDAGDFQHNGLQLQINTASGTTDKLLMEIRDLLQTQTRIQSKADDTDKSDEDEENKNDWKLAAVVFDRVFLIVFSILLLGGTIFFVLIFAFVYVSYM